MKFLCDNCKAKYQIADEKVAGKTVRMKCRKCGHQIEVRAAVTETSVSTSPPTAGSADVPRPVAKNSLATSLSAQKPRAPMASSPQTTGALAGAFQRNVQDAPQSVPNPGAGGSGAGASSLELSVTDEWYVAINGVPVGPVRISELRRKAASGAVNEDSLCWQEGLEEWRPVRSIPDLAAIVREAAQGNRPSLISPAPNEGRGSSPPGPRAPQRPTPAPMPAAARSPEPPAPAPVAPPRPMTSPSRSNVVPLRVAASSASDEIAPITAPLGGGAGSSGYAAAASLAPSPTYTPAPAFAPPVQMQQAPMPTAMPVAIADPFAVPPAPAPAVQTTSSSSMVPVVPYGQVTPHVTPSMVPPTRRAVPLWFWPILLFTGVFGALAAVFVFRQQQQPPPVVIQMSATNAPPAAEVKSADPPPSAVASNDPPPVASTPSAGKVAATPKAGGATAVAAATPEKKGGVDVSGLLGGAGGPNVGGSGGPGPAAGGGLDGSSVERVVASHRAGVKRTCWERGGAGQPSANVTVTATVAPDGSVSNTSSSGDDPVVGKCIESQVRTWRFNAPGATTTVNIPFKFVRQ